MANTWVLPDGINEILAPNGWTLEKLRRNILDLYQSWGYDYVIPPIVEHLDSLLTGTGKELELQTFKLTDLISGRLIGLRADITPQIARIDASQNHGTPSRYCYVGTVLHTRAFDFNGVRDPIQIGVELFGNKSSSSDIEVICLMLETLKLSGVKNLTLDLGHLGIINTLLKDESVTEIVKDKLYDAISRKSFQDVLSICENNKIAVKELILNLIECNGSISDIESCRLIFDNNIEISKKLTNLLKVAKILKKDYSDIDINIDLAELKGYQYHTGITFSAYVAGKGKEIARGGSYDEIGKEFGKFRAATGFSTDLKSLLDFSNIIENEEKVILAPLKNDDSLSQLILKLRQQKNKVIQSFEEEPNHLEKQNCTHLIQLINNQWQVVEAHGE